MFFYYLLKWLNTSFDWTWLAMTNPVRFFLNIYTQGFIMVVSVIASVLLVCFYLFIWRGGNAFIVTGQLQRVHQMSRETDGEGSANAPGPESNLGRRYRSRVPSRLSHGRASDCQCLCCLYPWHWCAVCCNPSAFQGGSENWRVQPVRCKSGHSLRSCQGR